MEAVVLPRDCRPLRLAGEKGQGQPSLLLPQSDLWRERKHPRTGKLLAFSARDAQDLPQKYKNSALILLPDTAQ